MPPSSDSPAPFRPAPARRGSFAHLAKVQTRWDDCDRYGHLNNTVHYRLFDTVVNRWLIYEGLLDLGGGLIGLVVESGCRYHAELGYPAPVEVGLRVGHLGRSSVRYELALFAPGSDNAAAEGFFTHVYVDGSTRRPAVLPDRWRAGLGALLIG
jgi:acyl-CoA thioester hydrolase